MKRVRLAAVLVLALVTATCVTLAWVRLPHTTVERGLGLAVRVTLKVNNKTVIAANDPLTMNFIRLVGAIFHRVGTIIAVNGREFNAPWWVIGGSSNPDEPARIWICSGDIETSDGMVYNITNCTVARISSFVLNRTGIVMSSAITASKNITIKYIGLQVIVSRSLSRANTLDDIGPIGVLAFYYRLPKPVTIKAGDTIAVTYTLHFEK